MQRDSRRSGHSALLATCALAASLLTGAASSVHAQQTPPTPVSGESLVTIDVRNASLMDAITMLSRNSNLDNIVVRTSRGREYSPVTMRMTDQPLRKVLDALASSAGAALQERDGVFYLVPPDEADPAPKPKTEPVVVVAAPAAKPRANRQLTKIKLTYLLPSVAKNMIDDVNWKPLIEDDVKMGLHYTPLQGNWGNEGLNSATPAATPNGAPKEVPINGATGGAIGSGAGRDGGSIEGAGARGQGLGGVGGGGGRFGGQGGGQGGGGQAGGGTLRPQGVTQIISNDADNSLLVEYDDQADLERLRELIKLLDIAPKQVIIRAEFVIVNLSDVDAFGIDWRFSPSGNTDVQIPPANSSAPTITLAYGSGNAVANLRAALTRTTQNVIQAPIIGTMNNVPASVNFTTTITVSISQNIFNNNGIVTQNQLIPVTATNGISVTPHINGDNSITMALTPQLNDVQTTADGGFTNTSQAIRTTRRVQNGETMVLGGFITKKFTRSITKVPLLSDLPIIGNLFTQRNFNQTGAETLVFITPTIIEDRSQGSIGTSGGGAIAAPTP